jgi:hypothetical protein
MRCGEGEDGRTWETKKHAAYFFSILSIFISLGGKAGDFFFYFSLQNFYLLATLFLNGCSFLQSSIVSLSQDKDASNSRHETLPLLR